MKEFQIWSEGYAITGNSSRATFHGTQKAKSFEEAVIKKIGNSLDKDSTQPDGYRRFGGKLCTWGCCYYDNETEARKSFG